MPCSSGAVAAPVGAVESVEDRSMMKARRARWWGCAVSTGVALGVAMAQLGAFGAEGEQDLARLPGVTALAESEHRDRWGLDGWHAGLAVDGNRDGKGGGARATCWASDNWEYTHSLVLVFPKEVAATGVTLFWGTPGDTPLTPRRGTVEGWSGEGWRTLARWEREAEEPATTLPFPAARVSALRISQPPEGAHPGADRRLWIGEVEVSGAVPEGAPDVPVAARVERFRAELGARRQAEADARVKPVLDVAMRVPKTRGFAGIIDREDVARGRANIAKHAWARQVSEGICKQADWWLDKSDEYIYSLIPEGNPRAICPSFEKGCPIHGGARNSFTGTMDAPYRWKCKAGGEEWYDGAVVKNPGTGAEVTVRDDGSGWLAPEGFPNAGRRYYFTAAYRYYILGKLFGSPYEGDGGGGYQGGTAVLQLALAYACTGDARYAHRAGVMLNRLAEVYRFMDGSIEGPTQRQDGYIGQTFERFWVQSIALACDLVWDEVTKDEALTAFFRAKGVADYDGDGAVSGRDIAYNLQRNLLGYIYEYVHRLMPYLDGDFLIYEMGGLAAVAGVLQNGALAKEMLEGDYGLRMLLLCQFFRDGKFIYDSTGYNVGNAQQVAALAEWLHGFRDGEAFKEPLDLYNDPLYRMGELLTFCRHVDCDGRVPQIGDTGGARAVSFRAGPPYGAYDERALLRMPGERDFYARRILEAAGGDVNAFRAGRADYWLVFHARDDLTPAPVEKVTPSPAPRSYLFPDSGIAILRAGSRAESRWHVPITFSKGSYGHGHPDKLSINVIAGGYDLSADLGYPTTWTDAKYGGWETNTASHWTVMLDGRGQRGATSGALHFFAQSPGMDVVEASCEAAYDKCPLYRRTVGLVRERPGGEPLYAVDLFRVAGGKVRDYLHHSIGSEVDLAPAGEHGEWQVQEKGTLAGPEVEFGTKGGYGFLKDVRRLAYDGPFSAEWRVTGSSQPDRYLLTRHSFGDCDIEFTVTRTGKASGPRERGVLVFHGDSQSPGRHRQVWIEAGGTMLPVGKPVRMSVQVRGGKATVRLDGRVVERATEVFREPGDEGRVGFLHYYDYAFRYDDLVVTPVGAGGEALREAFDGPLSGETWERIDPTYEVAEGALVASDSELLALRLLVPGGLGTGTEVIRAQGEGHGLRGRSPWEAHVIVRDRKDDLSEVSAFASVIEVHRGAPRVLSVTRLPLAPSVEGVSPPLIPRKVGGLRGGGVALRVECAGGRVDYVLSALGPEGTVAATDGDRRLELAGRFGWVSFQGGRPVSGHVVGGGLRCGAWKLESDPGAQGRVVETDVEANRLRVRLDRGALRAGDLLLVKSDGFLVPSVYPVSGAARQGDGTWLVDVGGMPLLVGWGRVKALDGERGAFATATPLLKLRFNAGLFNGRRVRPKAENTAPEARLRDANEGAFVLDDPAGLKAFAPGGEYFVYDVGAGDRVEVVASAH